MIHYLVKNPVIRRQEFAIHFPHTALKTNITFVVKSFAELDTMELYRIYQLRSRIFIVEQACAYQDVDEKDLRSLHVMMFEENRLIGYSRLLPPGVSYAEAAIGRVSVDTDRRGHGYGKELMGFSMARAIESFRVDQIVISAQCYLKVFYTALGFVPEGPEYPEDNIPHIKMRYRLK